MQRRLEKLRQFFAENIENAKMDREFAIWNIIKCQMENSYVDLGIKILINKVPKKVIMTEITCNVILKNCVKLFPKI